MKKISDIRLFKSVLENVDRNDLPVGFTAKHLYVIMRRIVLKLRENNYSLGDFDHLFLNFTTCLEEGDIQPAKRSVGQGGWSRFYDVGVSQVQFQSLEAPAQADFIVDRLQETLLRYFSGDGQETVIRDSIRQAVEQGEQMQMVYKTKESGEYKAVLSLRVLNSGEYFPLLCVYDGEGKLIVGRDLDRMRDLSALGEMRMAAGKVQIYPRKNGKAKTFRPITVEY